MTPIQKAHMDKQSFNLEDAFSHSTRLQVLQIQRTYRYRAYILRHWSQLCEKLVFLITFSLYRLGKMEDQGFNKIIFQPGKQKLSPLPPSLSDLSYSSLQTLVFYGDTMVTLNNDSHVETNIIHCWLLLNCSSYDPCSWEAC